MPRSFVLTALCVALLAGRASAEPKDYFAIRVVDEETGRGVPLVYLQTTYEQRYLTDSAGYVAFNEPGLMDGRDVWFSVKSYGYEEPPGAFGIKGVQLKPKAGGAAEIRIKRKQLAERLYRMTGYGIYRDSVLLGKPTPMKEPLLNGRTTGMDTVQCAIYRGKMRWMWQDTDRVGFELGNFRMTGATTPLPDKLNADRGLDFTFFVERPSEFVKSMAVVPREGNNPVWVDGLTVVKDDKGQERMIARYAAVKADMSPVEVGLLVYNDEKDVMERLAQFENVGRGVLAPSGHAVYVRDNGVRYAMFDGGVRVKADFASARDRANYEAFTCLNADGTANRKDGKLVWAWVRGGKPVNAKRAGELVKAKTINAEESPYGLKDVDSDKHIAIASGGFAWNDYLKCWLYVFGQQAGDSLLGEVWISTANSPEGPWSACRKVATHAMEKNNNDFYNVVQHYELSRENGRYVYFSGTFVNTFSGNPWPTPYYNYNNILYRLDLADPRLKLPPPPPGLTKTKPDDN